MKLKKFIAVIAAAAVCMTGLTSCSPSEQYGSSDRMGGAKSGKLLRVGVKDSAIGFGYIDPILREYVGMEIELAKKLADGLGYDGVEFTTVTAATRTELLDSGDVDCVLATFSVSEERKKIWDFSAPYYTDAVTVLVETNDGIRNVDGLVGKKIGVSKGSNSAYNLVKAMIEKGLMGDYKLPENVEDFDYSSFDLAETTFWEFDDYPTISNAMAAGAIDAFCVDKSILANFKIKTRSYIEDSFAPQDYGVATQKGSKLSAPINELITKWLSDGTIDGLISKFRLD